MLAGVEQTGDGSNKLAYIACCAFGKCNHTGYGDYAYYHNKEAEKCEDLGFRTQVLKEGKDVHELLLHVKNTD